MILTVSARIKGSLLDRPCCGVNMNEIGCAGCKNNAKQKHETPQGGIRTQHIDSASHTSAGALDPLATQLEFFAKSTLPLLQCRLPYFQEPPYITHIKVSEWTRVSEEYSETLRVHDGEY